MQCLVGLTLLGQGEAVQDRTGSRGRPGCLDQNGGDGATVYSPLVDAEQKQDARHRLHVKSKRQGQGDPHGRRHPGDGADDAANNDAKKQGNNVIDGGKQRKSNAEVLNHIVCP